jgi:hypothetical protein
MLGSSSVISVGIAYSEQLESEEKIKSIKLVSPTERHWRAVWQLYQQLRQIN